MNLDYPYGFDTRGRTSLAADTDHIDDMIETFLFTSAGERVMLPEFGSGVTHLVHGPNSPEIAAALQFTVQGGLQRWLGDVIEVQDLSAESDDAMLRVKLVYVIRRTQEVRTRVFERSLV